MSATSARPIPSASEPFTRVQVEAGLFAHGDLAGQENDHGHSGKTGHRGDRDQDLEGVFVQLDGVALGQPDNQHAQKEAAEGPQGVHRP